MVGQPLLTVIGDPVRPVAATFLHHDVVYAWRQHAGQSVMHLR